MMDDGGEDWGRIPQTVVVPLDGSDFAQRAVAFGSTFAARFDADLVLMTTPLTREPAAGAVPPPWLEDAATRSGYDQARPVLVDDGHPASAITSLAGDLPDAVVCMTTHGHGRIVGTALGSVAEEVIHRLATPAILVGPHCSDWRQEHPMVVCHDGSSAADTILAPSRMWADAFGLPIVLVHVFHPLDVESAREPTKAIAHAVEYFGPAASTRVLRSSYPFGMIRAILGELEPSLVALATHGRTGIARLALGSVATSVVRTSPCPVLVARPNDLS